MKVIESEQIVYCDVDDTLLMWNVDYPEHPDLLRDARTVMFLNPHSMRQARVSVNFANLEVLKGRLRRGATVIVHSASGWMWAEQAVIALGLQDEPNIYVASKPLGYIDDKKCDLWMGDHIYLDVDNKYGRG